MSTTTVLTATDIPTDALAAWLAEQTWSDFAQSLAAFFADRGFLTGRHRSRVREQGFVVSLQLARLGTRVSR